MFTVKQNTTLIGVSELRTRMEEILKKTHGSTVVIEKRHKPVAVLLSNKDFEKTSRLLEIAGDIVLGYLAKKRFEGSTENDYINIESALKKVRF